MAYIETQIYKILGSHLRIAREAAGLTLSDVAEKLSATPMTIQRYEKGDRKISVEKIRTLCALYNVNADQLMQSSIDSSSNSNLLTSDIANLLQDKPDQIQHDALLLMEIFVDCNAYNQGKILAYAQGIADHDQVSVEDEIEQIRKEQIERREKWIQEGSVPTKKSV